jgi:hypothetical protein
MSRYRRASGGKEYLDHGVALHDEDKDQHNVI